MTLESTTETHDFYRKLSVDDSYRKSTKGFKLLARNLRVTCAFCAIPTSQEIIAMFMDYNMYIAIAMYTYVHV